MKQKEFKYVKGRVKCGEPATICFFSDVEYWNVQDFIYEFNYIKDYCEPSEIRILINSSGGSCIDGISAFSTIINCKIPTVCIIEGIAASMASIIWAAGKKCQMRDYALLMIHNPWSESEDNPEKKRVIENFTAQLRTIYMKRFCMDEEKVTAIMNGEDNLDGTYFTADQAVEAGFITQDQVIVTPGIDKSAIAAKLKDVNNADAVMSLMQGTIDKNLKVLGLQSISDKEDNLFNNKNNITMNQEFTVVAALLGMTGEKANENAVTAKIQDLVKAQHEFETLKASHKTLSDQVNALKVELEGSKASAKNLQENLDKTNASLKVYQDKEVEARNAAIEAMVEGAIKASKITKENKEVWVNMAQANFDLAKQTLDSIPAREDIQGKIANNPANKQDAQEQMTDEEKALQAKVAELVGEGFKFRTAEEL